MGKQERQGKQDELNEMVGNDVYATTVITEFIHDLTNQPLIDEN